MAEKTTPPSGSRAAGGRRRSAAGLALAALLALVPEARASDARGEAGAGPRAAVPPRVRNVEVVGNRDLPASRIVRRAGLRAGTPLEDGALERAAAAVLEEYHREGFLLASVQAVAEPASAGRSDVRLEVSEGPRVHLAEVTIEGAEEISAAEARRALGIQPRRLFGLLSPGRYVPEDLEGALARLREHYRSRGHLSALVGFGGLELDGSLRRARLRILVREGPRYRIAEARVEGSRLFPREDLERAVASLRGAPYSSSALEEATEELRAFYLARSDRLPAIAVRTEYREDDSVAAVFEIREERFVETGLVSISGNRFTRDRVIRTRVGLVPGEPFSPREVQRTLERIRALGYFTKTQIELEEREEPGAPETTFTDVRVEVEEPERLGSLLEVGGGASSGSGSVFYVGVRRANFDLFRLPKSWDDLQGAFRGGGQYIDLTFLPGTKESQYSVRFEEPYLFRSDLSLSLSSGVRAYEREAYDEHRIGGSLQVRKSFDADRRWSAAAAWIFDRVRTDDIEAGAPPDVLAAEGRTSLSHPRLELRYDGLERNAYSGPEGLFARAHADFASGGTGSDVSFARVVASLDWFAGVFEPEPDTRHVLHIGVRGMWIRGLGGDRVPLFERFFLGGPRSFRGFEYRGLGPREAGVPLGGEAGIAGTIEYSFPIVWREIRGVAVFDWGDLEPSLSDVRLGRFRAAAGGGIRLRLRVFGQEVPANFTWVHDLASERGDRTQLFSFTVGTEF